MERNIEALKQLRRVVSDAPDDLFHMRAVTEQSKCGTARCAAGWAIIDPWFQKNTRINEAMPADWSNEGLSGANIIEQVFGLDEGNSERLFAMSAGCNLDAHDITKIEVIANIDRLIAGEDAEEYEALCYEDRDYN